MCSNTLYSYDIHGYRIIVLNKVSHLSIQILITITIKISVVWNVIAVEVLRHWKENFMFLSPESVAPCLRSMLLRPEDGGNNFLLICR
jgi:hypothetical protein